MTDNSHGTSRIDVHESVDGAGSMDANEYNDGTGSMDANEYNDGTGSMDANEYNDGTGSMDEERVVRGYDRWSQVYDHDENPLSALDFYEMQRVVGPVKSLRILDLGCGTGKHSLWMAKQGAWVTGIDFSQGMLSKAREKTHSMENVNFLVHNLSRPLPLSDSIFDGVVSGLVLEHLKDLPLFFGEIRRVLKPQGRAVISAMHPAMYLIGKQAKFTDPESKEVVEPGSIRYGVGDFIMSAIESGLKLSAIEELSPHKELAARFPRAQKYLQWPMLFIMSLDAS